MSQENVEIVTAHYEAFNVRNLDALLGTCAEDVEIDDTLRVDAGLYQGQEQVGGYFAGLWEVASSAEVAPVELRCRGNRVWVRAKVWARGAASGAGAGMTFAHVFTIRDGQIARIEVYSDPNASPQSRRAGGVGDVAGEHGASRRSVRLQPQRHGLVPCKVVGPVRRSVRGESGGVAV